MAVNFSSTAFRPHTIALGLTAFDRKAIERQIEALIELLDTLDGDIELEDDELHDDPLDLGEETSQLVTLPIYAVDQTGGPVNIEAGYAAYRRAQCEQAA